MAFRRTFSQDLLAVTFASIVNLITVPHAAQAADADPLQDFCVADFEATSLVNGYPCKDPETVTSEDFAFAGLAEAADLTDNPWNASATSGFVFDWPALNTQRLPLARLDINPGGVIMPHTHNLATEILFCLEGEIYTGFVTNSFTNAQPNKLYAKTVKKSEAFIFRRGVLHFQFNYGTKPAVSLNVLNGQNPGLQLMPIALFGVGIDPEIHAKSFLISEKLAAKGSRTFSQYVS